MRNIVLIVLLQLFLCTVMAKEELLKVISASVSPSLIGGFSGVLGPQQVQSKGDDNSMASLSCLLSLQRLKNSRSLIQNSTSLGELGKALCGIQPQVTRDVQDFYSSPIDLNKNKMKHLQKLLESLKIQRNNGGRDNRLLDNTVALLPFSRHMGEVGAVDEAVAKLSFSCTYYSMKNVFLTL